MSRAPVRPELPDEVVRRYSSGGLGVVATVDDDGRPATTLMSWLVARSSSELALCVDTRSRSFANLVARPAMALELVADDLAVGVKGRATVAKERMTSTPFPCALVVVTVEEARDHASPGTVLTGPRYSYAEDKQHRLELEARIFAELRAG